MSTTQAAIYARVSSERQATAQTIASQLAALRERVTVDGYMLPEAMQFLDDGYSGTTLVRPALERLRDLVAAGAVDRLYIHSPDRLARKYAYQGLDHGTGHFPTGLPLPSPWWTQRRWWEINGCQNRGKHRPRFLTEKSLRCGCAVCTCEEKVVNRRQTCTLSRAI
jgi:hypothetical protein